jgi:hypothetical protein
MKMLFLLSTLMMSLSSYAAIGCLPGDCCNGHPCSETPVPTPAPIPHCPGGRPLSTIPASFELNKRAVGTCTECREDEVCAEYSNSLGEVLGHECKVFSK